MREVKKMFNGKIRTYLEYTDEELAELAGEDATDEALEPEDTEEELEDVENEETENE